MGWLVALNPLALKTVSVLLLSWVLYLITIIMLGHTYLGNSMQWQIEDVPLEALKNGTAVAALCLSPLALLADIAVFGAFLYFRPTALDRVRWQGARNKLNRVEPEKSSAAVSTQTSD